MKKTGLFKIIMYVLLGIVVMTWIFSASYFQEGELAEMGMYNIGFFDYFQLIFSSFTFGYFIQILILLVSVGALYGVLAKTGKYRALIDRIATNLNGIELLFLIGTAVVIALITSIFDYGFALFIFLPLVIGIILAMGYDKITACLATFGAMLVGTIGSTLGYNTTGTITGILNADITTGMIYKLVLLVLSLSALIFFLAKAKRMKKGKTEVSSKKTAALTKGKKTKAVTLEEPVETETVDSLFIGEKISNKYSVVPIIVVLSLVFVLLVLGCTKWSEVFGVNAFAKANETVTNFTVKLPQFHITSEGVEYGMEEVAIFAKLLGKNVAFGEWYYSDMAIICLIAAFVLGLFYRMKLKETFKNMTNGALRMLEPALLVIFIYTVIYFAANAMFFPTIAEHLLNIGNGFNIFFNTIVSILGSALHVDILYVANYMLPQMAAQEVSTTVLTILTQSMYGVTMFIAPTSVVLALGLSYLGISYKDWIKKVWPLTLILFAISVAVSVATMLIQ